MSLKVFVTLVTLLFAFCNASTLPSPSIAETEWKTLNAETVPKALDTETAPKELLDAETASKPVEPTTLPTPLNVETVLNVLDAGTPPKPLEPVTLPKPLPITNQTSDAATKIQQCEKKSDDGFGGTIVVVCVPRIVSKISSGTCGKFEFTRRQVHKFPKCAIKICLRFEVDKTHLTRLYKKRLFIVFINKFTHTDFKNCKKLIFNVFQIFKQIKINSIHSLLKKMRLG